MSPPLWFIYFSRSPTHLCDLGLLVMTVRSNMGRLHCAVLVKVMECCTIVNVFLFPQPPSLTTMTEHNPTHRYCVEFQHQHKNCKTSDVEELLAIGQQITNKDLTTLASLLPSQPPPSKEYYTHYTTLYTTLHSPLNFLPIGCSTRNLSQPCKLCVCASYTRCTCASFWYNQPLPISTSGYISFQPTNSAMLH